MRSTILGRINFIWAGIIAGIVYWFIESSFDAYVYHLGSFSERLISPDPNEFWMRIILIAILGIFGLYAQISIKKELQAKEEIRRINDGLEQRITERTAQLESANRDLKDKVIERTKAERRLATQYAISRILTESVALDEAADKVLQALCIEMGWDIGEIWRVDREKNALVCANIWHQTSIDISEFKEITWKISFLPGCGIPGRVWSTGKPVWIANVAKEANFPRGPCASKIGLHGAFGFPVKFKDEVLGIVIIVVLLFNREIRQPDEEQIQLFASVGSQLGQFFERKRVEEELIKSENKYKGIVNTANTGIFQSNLNRDILYLNDTATRMIGFNSLQEAVSGGVGEFYSRFQ
ncbi:MAG: GAF domain-containing protein [Nitrospirae bacterium]|nr:GAF domain-containing protein [Nitrospirota bacterium]